MIMIEELRSYPDKITIFVLDFKLKKRRRNDRSDYDRQNYGCSTNR